MSIPADGRRHASNPAEVPVGTLVELFFDAVDAHAAPDALRWREADAWRQMGHAELEANVRALAGALEGMGVARGDRVALLSESRPEWALTDYALLCAGLLTVPVYATLPAGQVAGIVEHSGARVLFVSTGEQLEKALAVRRKVPTLETIVVFEDAYAGAEGVRTLRELLAEGGERNKDAAAFRERARAARPEDVATLIYTSGTTGKPKGVMLTHANLYGNAVAAANLDLTDPGDVALSFLPLSHVLQRMVDYWFFSSGVSIAYVPDLDELSRAFNEVRPTVAVAVPRVYEKVYARILAEKGLKRPIVLWARGVALAWADETLAGRRPSAGLRLQHALADRLVFAKVRARLGGRIRFFVSGGGPLAPQVARFFYGAGVLILEGYGLTETSPVTNVNLPGAMRIGTVGRAFPGTEIRIADDGEILIRGPQVMKGYFDDPEATAAVIDAEGWFSTGDIGELDADGFLRITDRKKDILVTAGGKNVAPQPVQNAAKESPFVAEAVMLGDRRPYPILLVVPNFDTLEAWARHKGFSWKDQEALAALPEVRAKLEREVSARLQDFARYEQPKKVLPIGRDLSLEEGEITPTLKVKRAVVEERFRDRIQALYDEPQRDPGDGTEAGG
ncbi:MAG: long-chain fatty acid--CoA ligase [Gemmatimonadota bacterium]